ncbi:hypothetical protein JB92DRAFT_2826280 [Gautieria morchelliformis]|nr:hypothetical protein JB92DRAFT_2826280 [Gautieria morchelliformis]
MSKGGMLAAFMLSWAFLMRGKEKVKEREHKEQWQGRIATQNPSPHTHLSQPPHECKSRSVARVRAAEGKYHKSEGRSGLLGERAAEGTYCESKTLSARVGVELSVRILFSFGHDHEIVAVEPTPAHRRKGWANAQVTESDKIAQSVAKHGYPEHAYLLSWNIYSRHEVLTRPVKCGRCLLYGHTCSGEAGKMCGRCIRDRQGCVAAEEYVAKDEKDGRELEAKEVKVKDKGSTTGPSSISSKGVLDTSEGTRTSTLAGEERMEELVERSEELMRSVS